MIGGQWCPCRQLGIIFLVMADIGFDEVYDWHQLCDTFSFISLCATLQVPHSLGDYCRGCNPGYPRVGGFVELLEETASKIE